MAFSGSPNENCETIFSAIGRLRDDCSKRSPNLSVRALVALARAKPNTITYASGGTGAQDHGTPEKLSLCGRVLQDEGFRPAKDTEQRWRQIVLAPDSEFVAAHAAGEGLIPATELSRVRNDAAA